MDLPLRRVQLQAFGDGAGPCLTAGLQAHDVTNVMRLILRQRMFGASGKFEGDIKARRVSHRHLVAFSLRRAQWAYLRIVPRRANRRP